MPGTDSQSELCKQDDCFKRIKGGKEEGTKTFLSPRKHINIPKRATNLDDFQKDVLCSTIFNIMTGANFLLPGK
jgi:hypothetical protein